MIFIYVIKCHYDLKIAPKTFNPVCSMQYCGVGGFGTLHMYLQYINMQA
jgi:hypothetical protein